MGSVAKLGLPLQHVPQLTQLLKLGTSDIDSIRTFVQVIEDVLFRLVAICLYLIIASTFRSRSSISKVDNCVDQHAITTLTPGITAPLSRIVYAQD